MRIDNRSFLPNVALLAAAAAVAFPSLTRADVPIAQFTPGDYLVMRGGDANNSNGSDGADFSGEVNAYIDEYSQSGYYVGTLPLSAMTLPGANASSHEGGLNISPNGQWIAFAGYDPVQNPAGTTSHNTDGTENGVLGEVNLSAGPSSLNMSTTIPGSSSTGNSLTGQYLHSALTIDGNEFYVAGKYTYTALGRYQTSDTGLFYVNGTGSSASTTVLEGGTDWRNLLVYNGQLYGGTGSSSVGTHGAYTIGTGIPTTNSPIPAHTNITSYPGGNSASSLGFADVQTSDSSAGISNGANVLYTIGDEYGSGITKYYYDPVNNVWNYSGYQLGLSTGNPTGLVVTTDPTNPAWVDLAVSGTNGIYTYIDKSGDPKTDLTGSFTQLVTPQSYASFYGMAQEPGPANVVWTSAGQTWDVGVSANWTYAGATTKFASGENVTFDDTSTSNQVTLNAAVQPGSVTFEATKNYSISGSGSIGGAGSLRLLPGNTATVTLATPNTYSGGTVVGGGLLKILPTNPTTSALGTGGLAINGNGRVTLADNVTLGSQSSPHPASNVHFTSLSISGNGVLDIGNNHIIVNYDAGADPISSIASSIATGYAAGHWNGLGIISTDAQTNSLYGIGYADSADPGNPAGLSSGQIEIMYTLLGDANLDGKVNGTDFTLMATNFNQMVSNGWDKGDFNYSNTVNGSDFLLLAGNFNQFASQSAVSSDDLSALDSFAASNSISLTSVPEPAMTGLFSLGAGIFLSRRKRNSVGSRSLSAGVRRSFGL